MPARVNNSPVQVASPGDISDYQSIRYPIAASGIDPTDFLPQVSIYRCCLAISREDLVSPRQQPIKQPCLAESIFSLTLEIFDATLEHLTGLD